MPRGSVTGTMTGGLNGSFRLTDAQICDDAGAVDAITADTKNDCDGDNETLTKVS